MLGIESEQAITLGQLTNWCYAHKELEQPSKLDIPMPAKNETELCVEILGATKRPAVISRSLSFTPTRFIRARLRIGHAHDYSLF